MQKFVFNGSSSGTICKNFHCASVMNAEDVTEPRLTLKQIERQKLEKRSKYNYRITNYGTSRNKWSGSVALTF